MEKHGGLGAKYSAHFFNRNNVLTDGHGQAV